MFKSDKLRAGKDAILLYITFVIGLTLVTSILVIYHVNNIYLIVLRI